MAHPRMYDDGDPDLATVRRLCAALPGTAEKESWGRPTFRAPTKMFAVYGSGPDRPHAVLVKPDPGEREALLEDDRFFSPPYFGPAGWVAVDAPSCDERELAELLASSYVQVATATLRRELEAEGLDAVLRRAGVA